MKRFFKIFGWSVLAIIAGLICLVLWNVYQMGEDSTQRCEDLRHFLFSKIDQAKEVRIIEHSNRWDYFPRDNAAHPEKIYATVVLNASQITQLKAAMFPSKDRSGTTALMCIFEPHHRIEILNPNGSVFVVEICFVCGELDIGWEQRILPDGWDISLKTFISSLSMRPDGPWKIEEAAKGASK